MFKIDDTLHGVESKNANGVAKAKNSSFESRCSFLKKKQFGLQIGKRNVQQEEYQYFHVIFRCSMNILRHRLASFPFSLAQQEIFIWISLDSRPSTLPQISIRGVFILRHSKTREFLRVTSLLCCSPATATKYTWS